MCEGNPYFTLINLFGNTRQFVPNLDSYAPPVIEIKDTDALMDVLGR